MRLFITLSSLVLMTLALPFPQQQAPANIGSRVVDSINYVSTQYSTVIAEIEQFGGDVAMANQVFQHAEETLRSLDNSLQILNQIKSFDISTTLQLVAPLTSLDLKVHQMATALKDKKDTIVRQNYGPRVHGVLRRTYDGANALMSSIVERLPVGVSAVVNILSKEITYTLGNVRDLFQVEGSAAPAAPIAIAPNGGYSPQYAPQPGPYLPQSGNNGYAPQNNYGPQNGYVPQYAPQPSPYPAPQNGYAPQNNYPQNNQATAPAPEQDTETAQRPSSTNDAQQAW